MPLLRGDLNNDNNIDINDIVILQNTVLGRNGPSDAQITTGYNIYSADLNNDNIIDINDIIILQNTVLTRNGPGDAQILPSDDPTEGPEDPPDGSRIQFENSASLIAVLNDSEHFVKDGDIIAAVDSEGDIYSYESLRVAKNDPPLPNEPNLATINMNNTTNRQYAYDTENYALIIALNNLGVTGSVVTYSIPSGQSISGSTEIISNIRQLTYTPPSSYTGTYVFNDSITYRVSNGTISKEGNISLSIEPKYYFAGNIGLETTMNNISYKYWDSDTRKIYDLIYSFGDNPSIISSDLIIGTPLNPVEFIINQTARKKFRIKKNKNIRNKIFPIRV